MCIVKGVADSWTLFGDSFEQKWISIENGSSKLTHSLFIAPFKNNIHSPWVGIRPFLSGSSLFCMRKPCFLASLSIGHTAKTQRTNQMSMAFWSEYSLCAHGFLILLYRCGLFYLNIFYKETKSAFFEFFYLLFKSFVKVELSYVFTINLFTIAENCTEKWIIL